MGNDDERAKAGIDKSLGRERIAFADNIMFREVLRDDRELCRQFLERVLGFPIERVEEAHFEYPLNPGIRSRGARFDLYIKGSDKAIDVEVQSSWTPALGRRLRYYQGTLDVSLVPRPQTYRQLPESYIIFICRYDPFKFGMPRYTIEPVCRECNDAEIGADLHWLVLNAGAFELEEELGLRNLLSYIEDGTVDENDPLVVGLDAVVDKLNRSDEVMAMIWSVEDEIGLREDLAAERAFAEGEARLSKLMKMLFDAGRIEDAERAVSDETYRAGLFKEFGIA